SDSGTAATTRLIAAITINSTGWPRHSPSTRTTAHSTTATPARTRPTPTRRCCSGVSVGPVDISAATRPIALRGPVAVATARPRSSTTTVAPGRSTTGSSGCSEETCSHGADPRVNDPYSTGNPAVYSASASAGTIPPSANKSCLPTTTSAAGT